MDIAKELRIARQLVSGRPSEYYTWVNHADEEYGNIVRDSDNKVIGNVKRVSRGNQKKALSIMATDFMKKFRVGFPSDVVYQRTNPRGMTWEFQQVK